jgi:23S rRNA (adenine2503-C2)-methyltransferase
MNEVLHLTGLTQDELVAFARELDQPRFRGRQIFRALHKRRLRSFAEMTDLPKDFRAALDQRATASTLKIESRYVAEDGTVPLFDKQLGDVESKRRFYLCILKLKSL